jgi:hypothetical protein
MSDVMPTIDVMPMTTPSTVSAERILFVRNVSIDIMTISPSNPERNANIWFEIPESPMPNREIVNRLVYVAFESGDFARSTRQ